MASNEVQLGGGYALGMFYTAPADTVLPDYPGDDLSSWTHVGDIDADGISYTPRDNDTLKNWAGEPKRNIPGSDPATVKAKIMDTTKSALQTVFGASNVVETAATVDHGKLLTIDLESRPTNAAFLFIMKDGDDMLMLGTEKGIVREVGDITFAPTEGITWEATIEAAAWTFAKDDGQLA